MEGRKTKAAEETKRLAAVCSVRKRLMETVRDVKGEWREVK